MSGGSRPLVLTSSARGPERLADGLEAPRIDFVELARLLEAPISYPPSAASLLGGVERKLGLTLGQALRARRRAASVWISFSEAVGLPLSTADRGGTPHVMLAHNLLRPRMRMYLRLTRSHTSIDRILVLSRSQRDYLCRHGADPSRVQFVYDKVDHRFWRSRGEPEDGSVLSVGRESRDYPTLIEAVRPLEVPTVLLAGSLWVGGEAGELPAAPCVSFRRELSFTELRAQYDRASVVVVPLRGGERYAAGVNAVLEAMAMAKALVVTATPGLADYVVDGENARLVPPRDPRALRSVLRELLSDGSQRAQLGRNARATIDGGRNLDAFVATLAQAVDEARDAHAQMRRS